MQASYFEYNAYISKQFKDIPSANAFPIGFHNNNSMEDTMESNVEDIMNSNVKDNKTITEEEKSIFKGDNSQHRNSVIEHYLKRKNDILEYAAGTNLMEEDESNDIAFWKIRRIKNCCNCKASSACLEANCECFLNSKFCEGCTCSHCRNISPYKRDDQNTNEEIGCQMILNEGLEIIRKRSRGAVKCNCGKGGCRRKQCECIQFGVSCDIACSCDGCRNMKLKKPKLENTKRKHK